MNEFFHHVFEYKLDICCVTETWLENENPKHLQVRSALKISGYDFIDVPRRGKIGGGTGIFFKENIKLKLTSYAQNNSFEYSTYKMESENLNYSYTGDLSPPPYSIKHKVTTTVFFEEFSDLLDEVLTKYQLVFICGDFNIHVNINNDLNSIALKELCDCMGLDQLVTCQTHRSGNTLDLIMVRSSDMLLCSEPTENYFLSEHSFIHFCISLPKPKCVRKVHTFRNKEDIVKEDFESDPRSYSDNAAGCANIEVLATSNSYSELLQIIDKHAPEQDKIITMRPTLL